jgi:signal transduction histidine kinase
MTDGAEHGRMAELRVWAHDARARSAASTAQAARAAESAAIRRGQAERMIERLAERSPQHATLLHAISGTAARERVDIGARKDRFYAARRAGGQLPPKRQDEPEAAALAALDVYLRDMAVVQERERIAGELLDNVIRRVFAAGLTLQGAAGLTTEPEVHQRIEEAAEDLDEVIQAIRNTVFNLPYPVSQP